MLWGSRAALMERITLRAPEKVRASGRARGERVRVRVHARCGCMLVSTRSTAWTRVGTRHTSGVRECACALAGARADVLCVFSGCALCVHVPAYVHVRARLCVQEAKPA